MHCSILADALELFVAYGYPKILLAICREKDTLHTLF